MAARAITKIGDVRNLRYDFTRFQAGKARRARTRKRLPRVVSYAPLSLTNIATELSDWSVLHFSRPSCSLAFLPGQAANQRKDCHDGNCPTGPESCYGSLASAI